jgi:hypothetical protein
VLIPLSKWILVSSQCGLRPQPNLAIALAERFL